MDVIQPKYSQTSLDAEFQKFFFISEALNGSGGFSPLVMSSESGVASITGPTHLIKYPRESQEKFARRNQLAWYRNFIQPACSRFIGYLSKKPPMRTITNPLLDSVVEDCDWRGNGIDVFWHSFGIEAKARGTMLLLIDMPKLIPPTQGQQIQDRAVPYFASIEPEKVMAYETNPRGLLTRIAFNDVYRVDTQVEIVWRVFTETEWWIQKPGVMDDPSLRYESGVHNLGVCPVLIFSESGEFPYVGTFAQIADLSRRYFNAASERDEILRSQTFSLLTYQVPPEQINFEPGEVAEAIGTHNMLVHRGDGPAFIAPPDGPATIYGEVLNQLEETIRRIALTVEQPSQAESGVALTIRFQELNSSLTSFARRMEDLERRAWDIVCRWLGVENTTEVVWAKSFELADLGAEMTTLQNMQSAGFPAEVIREAMKNITQLQFSTLQPQELDQLMMAIDNGASEIQPAPGQPQDQNSNPIA